jgi:hypothetical protein
MLEKNQKIKDFIGQYDGYISDSACEEAIELFNRHESFKKVLSRIDSEDATQDEKNDTQLFFTPDHISDIEFNINKIKPIMAGFKEALEHYYLETNIKQYVGGNLSSDYFKIQKTIPTQGYHIWHIEQGYGRGLEQRVLAYTIYLNDVDDGGETEFLLQSQRVKPVKGRIVIWPAGFPYVHRGNPPLSGEKYIITSWLNYYCQC